MPKQTFLNLEENKRALIIKYSMEEFSSHSYNEASVNTIVKKAGISKGSLYQYFEDKKDLYFYMLEIAGNKKFQYLKTCEESIESDDIYEIVTELMIRGCEFDLSNPAHSRFLYQALTGPLVDDSLEQMRAMNHQYMKRLLEKGIKQKQVRSDVDLDMMTFFLNSMIVEFAKYIASEEQFTHVGQLYHPENLQEIQITRLAAKIRELMKLIKSGLSPL